MERAQERHRQQQQEALEVQRTKEASLAGINGKRAQLQYETERRLRTKQAQAEERMQLKREAWAEEAHNKQVMSREKAAQIEKQQWLRAQMLDQQKQDMHDKRAEKERKFDQVKYK